MTSIREAKVRCKEHVNRLRGVVIQEVRTIQSSHDSLFPFSFDVIQQPPVLPIILVDFGLPTNTHEAIRLCSHLEAVLQQQLDPSTDTYTFVKDSKRHDLYFEFGVICEPSITGLQHGNSLQLPSSKAIFSKSKFLRIYVTSP